MFQNAKKVFSAIVLIPLLFHSTELIGTLSFNELQVQSQVDGLLPIDSEILDQLSGVQYTNDPYLVGLLSQQFIRRLYDPIRIFVVDPCYTPYCDGITFWSQGGWGHDQLRNDGNGFGFHSTSLNLTWGAQKTFLSDFTFGAGLSYDYEYIHYNLNGYGRMNSGFLGLYGLYRPDRFYVLADAAFGYTQNKVHRNFVVEGFVESADSRPKFYNFTAYLEIGFDLPLSNLLVQPFAAIESISYCRNGFSESNESELGLSFQKLDHTNALTRAGLHVTTYEHCWGFYFSADISWNYRFTSSNHTLSPSFLSFGTPFNIKGVPIPRNSVEGAITVSNHITEKLRSYIEITGEAWARAATYNLQLGLQYLY